MGVFKRFYFGAMETGGYWGFVLAGKDPPARIFKKKTFLQMI
jgi:hypothetical protein